MPVSYASNASALKAITKFDATTRSLNKTFERLSSGARINSASDDPAGLALADKLRAETRIASVAIRNANDGISLTSVADAALSEISNVLIRMAELAEQSANGVFTNTQRSALSAEFLALGSEIERIAVSTEFNDIKLLSNSSSVSFQVGITGGANSVINLQSVLGTLASVGLANSGTSALAFSIIDTTTLGAQSASQLALNAVNTAINNITSSRGTLGATESRLNSAISTLSVLRENLSAAESRIRDVDVATETAELTRLSIVQQASTAIIAQANLQPQVVLNLLR